MQAPTDPVDTAAAICLVLWWAALFVLFVRWAVSRDDYEGPLNPPSGEAKPNGNASRSMPPAVRITALPCIECPHLKASRQLSIPENRLSDDVQ